MVFSSLLFLFAFLPVTLCVYWATPARYRNFTALLASAVFYAWGAPRFLFLLVGSTAIDYAVGRGLAHTAAADTRRRHELLAVGVIVNLGVLIYFKYANFFVADINALLGGCGLSPLAWADIALPIGISFFTFHKLSYLIDVYRGTVEPARSWRDYLLYILLFPQLIAGPIIRYHDVAAQFERRQIPVERVFSGFLRFAAGLGKKVLIANTLATGADLVFSARPATLAPLDAWLGVLCYSFQIYFDFSGYSDMAIGLGRMMGFAFLENFNHPYIARSFTDFWRRWHISLSNFMREYLYIPLGGNRGSRFRTYLNLWLVFFLSGLWHGAAWTFVVWGSYHGLFMTLDKLAGSLRLRKLPAWLALPLTFGLVAIGWVFFRADSLPQALSLLQRMLVAPWMRAAAGAATLPQALGSDVWTALGAAALLSFLPALPWRPRIDLRPAASGVVWLTAGRFAAAVVVLILSAAALASGGFNPFVYFRF